MRAIVFCLAGLLTSAADAQDHVHNPAVSAKPPVAPASPTPTPPADRDDHTQHAPAPKEVSEPVPAQGKGRILYYRNPMGEPDTSPVPKKDSMGMDYIPVYESAVSPAQRKGRILHYKNPMGEPDTSPVPKKDSMGMDYIPVYESDVPPVQNKGRILYYKNPMGEPDTSPVPKKDSMGMDYIPVYESEVAPTITDHAADRVYNSGVMAEARALLKKEHGGEPAALVSLNIFELQVRNGQDGYRWDGEAWYGGDEHRAVVKFEGEGELSGGIEEAEIQALYARPIGPYFNLEAGLRYDFKPNPSRKYALVSFEGLAPYWFEVGGALFVSNKGDVHARIEGYYDLNVTQRLILQPRTEIDIAAQDIPELNVGGGISTVEAELRLRYEIRREFGPYIGVTFESKVGGTADLARAAGEHVSSTSLVAGVRFFF